MSMRMSRDELLDHFYSTYASLRGGMGIIAFMFPLILFPGGLWLSDTPLQSSMSHYYHTDMRNVFVGLLFSIGSFLYLYKGFGPRENYALNIAGLLALGVAIFPMKAPVGAAPTYTSPLLHGICAVTFCLFIAYVCIRRSGDTLHLVAKEHRKRYARAYKTLGWLMVGLPISAALILTILNQPFGTKTGIVILAIEWAIVWVFAAYWLLKTYEIGQTRAEIELTAASQDTPPKTMRMETTQLAFHTEEYKQIRTEVGVLLVRVENLFKYSLIVTATIYAWLITQSVGLTKSNDICLKLPVELLRPGWLIPPVFVVLSGLLAFAAYWRVNQMGTYLKTLEGVMGEGQFGWEKFLKPKRPVVTGTTVFVWIILFVAAGYGAMQGLAVTKDKSPACTAEPTSSREA